MGFYWNSPGKNIRWIFLEHRMPMVKRLNFMINFSQIEEKNTPPKRKNYTHQKQEG